MKGIFNFLIGITYAFFFVYYNTIQAATHVCEQEYALCTSASCIPTPDSSTTAQCDCMIAQGKSIGYKSCKDRTPTQDKYNVTHLISTFSFDQFKTKMTMSCSKGMPWTDCLDMPCTKDPLNSKRALCTCKINNTEAFVTLGGECDTATCKNGFWSGATQATESELRNALQQNSKDTGVSAKTCTHMDK